MAIRKPTVKRGRKQKRLVDRVRIKVLARTTLKEPLHSLPIYGAMEF
jgi:hypothetical protein